MSLLKIKNLQKVFRSADSGDENVVIKNTNLEVKQGEFLCILGPSGCGKTTLIRCVAGFEEFDGEISINGKKKVKPDTERTMVFQEFNQLLPWKTVEKNVWYPLKLKGIKDKNELKKISDEYLEKVGLTDYRNYYPHQLSGGMKQRCAIARSLAVHPDIILMDEPFASLDAITRANLQDELLALTIEKNITVIFITHNINEALRLGTRIIVMAKKGGEIIEDITPGLKRPITPASTSKYNALWGGLANALGRKLTSE